jgi:DNA-binding transcriptional LysR family regulator
MPSLKQIRYFLTVADLGGFTPAAAALFVAQPALSRQVAQLEEELGFALFEREPRGVCLTPAGAVYRDRVTAVQNLLAAAAEEGGQLANGEAGVLRLLHSSSIPAGSLMPVIERFLQSCPKARIDLDRIASELQVTEVASGKADLGVIRLPVLRCDTGVRFVELPAERLWVALPAGHTLVSRDSLGMADLQREAFVSAVHRERGGLARLVTDLCLRQGFVPKTARVVSRKTSMLNLVAAGLGIAVIPERMTTQPLDGVVYRPLRDPEAVALCALVLPVQPTPLAQAFADLMTQASVPEPA